MFFIRNRKSEHLKKSPAALGGARFAPQTPDPQIFSFKRSDTMLYTEIRSVRSQNPKIGVFSSVNSSWLPKQLRKDFQDFLTRMKVLVSRPPYDFSALV